MRHCDRYRLRCRKVGRRIGALQDDRVGPAAPVAIALSPNLQGHWACDAPISVARLIISRDIDDVARCAARGWGVHAERLGQHLSVRRPNDRLRCRHRGVRESERHWREGSRRRNSTRDSGLAKAVQFPGSVLAKQCSVLDRLVACRNNLSVVHLERRIALSQTAVCQAGPPKDREERATWTWFYAPVL